MIDRGVQEVISRAKREIINSCFLIAKVLIPKVVEGIALLLTTIMPRLMLLWCRLGAAYLAVIYIFIVYVNRCGDSLLQVLANYMNKLFVGDRF